MTDHLRSPLKTGPARFALRSIGGRLSRPTRGHRTGGASRSPGAHVAEQRTAPSISSTRTGRIKGGSCRPLALPCGCPTESTFSLPVPIDLAIGRVTGSSRLRAGNAGRSQRRGWPPLPTNRVCHPMVVGFSTSRRCTGGCSRVHPPHITRAPATGSSSRISAAAARGEYVKSVASTTSERRRGRRTELRSPSRGDGFCRRRAGASTSRGRLSPNLSW
jgi:hypothetical protein